MYTVNKTNYTGEVVGWVKFSTNADGGPPPMPPAGRLAWIKSQAVDKVTNYVNGITNTSAIMSSRFTPATKANPLVLWNQWNASWPATFIGGGMTNAIRTELFVDMAGTVYCTMRPSRLRWMGRRAFVSGKIPYNNDSNSKVSFSGVILQNIWICGGYLIRFGTFSGGGKSGQVVLYFY